MILDLRIYTAYPGKLVAMLKFYEEHGYPVQVRHLGDPVFYATTETGPLNQAVHVWSYQSMADREEKRARMEADPAWIEYRRRSAEVGYLMHQENRLLKSTSFSPL